MYMSRLGKAIATLKVFLSRVAWLHKINDKPDPTESELVEAVFESIKRRYTSTVTHKRPVTKDMLYT